MKFFSKQGKTRLLTLLLGGALCVSAAAGVATLTKSVDAEATYAKPEVMKIETIVDGRKDLHVVNGVGTGHEDMGTSWAVNAADSYATSGGTYYLDLFDEIGHNENNPVEYNGDVGLWYDVEATEADTTSTSNRVIVGFKLKSKAAMANGGYGIVSFRTRWTTGNGDLSLGMMVNPGSAYVRWDDNGGIGYWFGLTNTKVNVVQGKKVEMQTAAAYTNAPAEGDVVVITYGVWESAETERSVYIKIENETQDNIAYETTVVDTDLTDNTVFTNNAGALAGTFCIARTAYSYTGMTQDPTLLIAGIEEPLFASSSYSLTDTSYSVEEGATLPALTEEGYAWANPEEKAVYGKTEYDATYTYEYYGERTVPVTVAVAVTPAPRVGLQLKKGATELYSDSLLIGESVKFDTLTLDNVDTVLGWTKGDSDQLLRLDTTFTAEVADEGQTIVYNVVDMDMKQYEGASIRTTVDEKGNGGLRFVAMFNTEDWAANAAYVENAYGVIVPADDATYYTEADGFTAAAYALGAQNGSFKGQEAHSSEQFNLQNAEGYSVYTITMTNVKYANYNRTFASMTYITVAYADGSTETFETNVVKRSVYEVALAAKAHHEANGGAVYSTAQMQVIDGYIANVVDVSYDGATLTVTDREGHALVRPYVLDGASKVEGNVVTLTLTSVAADSLLANSESAPVWYTANGATNRYKAAVAYENGTATVTFTVA